MRYLIPAGTKAWRLHCDNKMVGDRANSWDKFITTQSVEYSTEDLLQRAYVTTGHLIFRLPPAAMPYVEVSFHKKDIVTR